jgi:hypothetical protein
MNFKLQLRHSKASNALLFEVSGLNAGEKV